MDQDLLQWVFYRIGVDPFTMGLNRISQIKNIVALGGKDLPPYIIIPHEGEEGVVRRITLGMDFVPLPADVAEYFLRREENRARLAANGMFDSLAK